MSNNRSTIMSINRAIEILELYDFHTTELGVSEISKQLDLNKATVYKILNTLESKGIIEQNPDTSKYFLGLKLYKLGILAGSHNYLISVVSPHLKSLTEKTKETSSLVIMDKYMCLFIGEEESNRMVRMFVGLGAKEYPHCCAAGKILLSEMNYDKVNFLLEQNGLPKFTDNTITTKEQLMQELKEIRANGYALDNEEREEGVMCIAAPIRDSSCRIIASISISGPKYRFEKEKLTELITIVKDEANNASIEMGYRIEKCLDY